MAVSTVVRAIERVPKEQLKAWPISNDVDTFETIGLSWQLADPI
jgi:hypothetical protein